MVRFPVEIYVCFSMNELIHDCLKCMQELDFLLVANVGEVGWRMFDKFLRFIRVHEISVFPHTHARSTC